MVLVFIILGIIILIFLIFFVLLLSTIKIEIKNLKAGNGNEDGFLFKNKLNRNEKIDKLTLRNMNKFKIQNLIINDKYEIKISLEFLEKIPFFMIKMNKEKLNKIRNNKKFRNMNFEKIRNRLKKKQPTKKQILHAIRKIKIKLEKINLVVYIGTEDLIITSYLIVFIASLIGIILPHFSGKNINNCKYEITPIYQNKNEYFISFDGIFCIKLIHIISNMLILTKKGREKKHERTSNRRYYAYRYE